MSVLSDMQSELAVPAHLDVMGDTVTVSRGDVTSDSFSAIVGKSTFQTNNDFGVTEFETRDFTFPPSFYDLGSGPVMPQRGDIFADGGFSYVVSTPQGIDFYSLDSDRIWLTVHTTKTV